MDHTKKKTFLWTQKKVTEYSEHFICSLDLLIFHTCLQTHNSYTHDSGNKQLISKRAYKHTLVDTFASTTSARRNCTRILQIS